MVRLYYSVVRSVGVVAADSIVEADGHIPRALVGSGSNGVADDNDVHIAGVVAVVAVVGAVPSWSTAAVAVVQVAVENF